MATKKKKAAKPKVQRTRPAPTGDEQIPGNEEAPARTEAAAQRKLSERAIGVGLAVPFKNPRTPEETAADVEAGGDGATAIPLGGGGRAVKKVQGSLRGASRQFDALQKRQDTDEIIVSREPIVVPPSRPAPEIHEDWAAQKKAVDEAEAARRAEKGIAAVPAPEAADVESVVKPEDRTPAGNKTGNLDLGEITRADETRVRRERQSGRNQGRRERLGLGTQRGVEAEARIMTRANKTRVARANKRQKGRDERAEGREVRDSLFAKLRDDKVAELGLGSSRELTDDHLAEIRGSMTEEALDQHKTDMEELTKRGLTQSGGTRGADSPLDAPKPKRVAETVSADDLLLGSKGRGDRAIASAAEQAGVEERHVRSFLQKHGLRDENSVVGLFSVLGQGTGRQRNNNAFVAESSKTVVHPETGQEVAKCASPDCNNPASKRAQVSTTTKFSARLGRDTQRNKTTSTSVPLCTDCHTGVITGRKKFNASAMDITEGVEAKHPLLGKIQEHAAEVEKREGLARDSQKEARAGGEAILDALGAAHSEASGGNATPVFRDAKNQVGPIAHEDVPAFTPSRRVTSSGHQFDPLEPEVGNASTNTAEDVERSTEVAVRQSVTRTPARRTGPTPAYSDRGAAPIGPKRPSPDKPERPARNG